jgi:hypothetical protein
MSGGRRSGLGAPLVDRQRGVADVAAPPCRRAYVDRLLESPNDERTPLGGNKLWQLGTLELRLQAHGI